MEEDDHSTNQPNTDTDQLQTLFQNHVINDPTDQHNTDHDHNQNPTQKQVSTPQNSIQANPSSELSFPIVDHTFTYDIHNAPDSDSLLYEILSRLPIKPLFKFKCVSKHWKTLISQPSFKRFCVSRMLSANAALSLMPFRILYKYICESKVEDVLDRFHPDSYSSKELYMSRDGEKEIKRKVLAVNNGLILCCSMVPLVYHVCNPVTRQWVTLAKTKNPESFGEGIVSRVNEDNVVTSFKVVRVEFRYSRSNNVDMDMFSSETGEWHSFRFRCADPIAFPTRGVGPICFNGILHWFVDEHGMVAFDPYKEPKSCRIIPLPADRDVQSEVRHRGVYRLCDGCQGKLRFFQVEREASSFYCFSMWDMKDYEKGEWCSEFKVTRSDLSSSDPQLERWLMKATFLPICFHPFDLDIVYLRCVELACLVSYNIQNRRLDVACKPTGSIRDLSWRVVVPFVIPRWPTPVPIPPIKVVRPNVRPSFLQVSPFPGPIHYLNAFP